MSSPIGHGLGAYALLISLEPGLVRQPETNMKALVTAVIFGTLADADFFIAPFTTDPVWGHHYFSHSILFALIFTLACYLFAKVWKHHQPWKVAGMLGAAYSSHLLLDYFTADGSEPIGIPLLWPFTHKHFAAPMDAFLSIHRGDIRTLFGIHNWEAVAREFAILLPIALIAFGISRRSAKQKSLQTKRP